MTNGEQTRLAHALAAKTGFDFRTCLKAVRVGPASIRTTYIRETLERELATRTSVGRS
jgi:hypothetical protein